jgi:hypothetical protein
VAPLPALQLHRPPGVLEVKPWTPSSVEENMSRSQHNTTLWQVVANMQERMEQQGLSQDLVDIIVQRGLELLLCADEERDELVWV